LNPWKDLLSKIFPGAETNTAPEDVFIPEDKPENPVERIHAMRKIRGSGGFARLYGAKDLEQFARQAEYMRDFEDSYPKEIPFGDAMPTYADMSLAQLRCYFSWRTETKQGIWREIAYSYVLLYLYELLGIHDNPEKIAMQLAACWLEMREYHPKLDAKLPQWLKDYYVSHEFSLPFGALVANLGLSGFFPEPSQRSSLLGLSSYPAGSSRFFRERPEYMSTLETAIDAAIKNLAPLFTLHGVNQEETFFMKPARFSFHELYRDAAAQPPAASGAREVRVSRNEIYRLRGGAWSRAMEDAFRPPSHAVGYCVKRLEGELRRLTGFTAPWSDPEGSSLLERWIQGEPEAFELAEDPRLAAILAESAGAALEPGAPMPVTETLARALRQEPLRTILSLRSIAGFVKQGKSLALLEDNFAETANYYNFNHAPCYAEMSCEQLRCYLTWRTKIRRGAFEKIDTPYALLYIRELESAIGTSDPLRALCAFLRYYAPIDRNIARVLPAKIEALARAKQVNLPKLLTEQGAQAWFPALFLFGDCEQLPVFDRLSSYKLTNSKFYKPVQAALFNACFDEVLRAAQKAFKKAGFSLQKAMRAPYAPALAGFLLKRMEQKLREKAHYPYAIKADPIQMAGTALGRSRLRAFVASGALTSAIDAAVDAFARENDLTPLAGGKRYAPKKKPPPPLPAPEPPPPPVEIDFSLLPKIRREAEKLTEILIVEDNEPVGVRRMATQPEGGFLPPERLDANSGGRNAIDSGGKAANSGGKNATPTGLLASLSPAQIAAIEHLCTGEGVPLAMDEITIEAINEVALEFMGDTLIEADGDGRARVIEEYRENWKEL